MIIALLRRDEAPLLVSGRLGLVIMNVLAATEYAEIR